MVTLTRRQAHVLDTINVFIETERRAPTVRELTIALGIKNASCARDHLRTLERKGRIRLDERFNVIVEKDKRDAVVEAAREFERG